MDPTERRAQSPPEARGDADLASTTEFKAFLAGDPIPIGDQAEQSRGSDGLLARLRALFQGGRSTR
jgi:hypothetical protein